MTTTTPPLTDQLSLSAITVFTEDLDECREFYARVFGFDPIFTDDDSAAYRFGPTIVNLLRDRAAGELIAPAEVGGPGLPRYVLTLDVEDVDATCELLAQRGVGLLNGPMDRPWGVRTASFVDPAGQVWEIAHSLKGKS